MAWITPKTNWATDDGVITTDLNRIEDNTVTLHKGNGQTALTTIASASSLDIGLTDETFIVSGHVDIDRISTAGRQPGNRIRLIFTTTEGAFYLRNAAGASSGYAALQLLPHWGTEGDVQVNGKECVELVYDGANWVFIS